jgi:uncharacterized membrane protein
VIALAPNPFDLKAALLAKHAQHVVLIHFPIALYLSGTVFDVCARIFRKSGLAEVARWNFLFAAAMSIPAAATGLLAWQWALERKHLQGLLLLHLLFACATMVGLWLTVWLRSKRRLGPAKVIPVSLLLIEAGVCVLVALTGHLGGFLSGVNTGS